MTNVLNEEKLTSFVKQTLGCRCPEEVFTSIHSHPMRTGELPGAATRIVVGDTLLIYLVPTASIRDLVDNLAEVADSGRRDRDSNGYNRFRLVVAANSGASERDAATATFAAEAGDDANMHIHFVDPATVLDLFAR
jgi:hypothetical protein